MLAQYSRNWWAFALRGVAAIILGILAFIWPGITILSLVLVFGVYAILDGVFSIIAAIQNRVGHDRWWVLLLEGIIDIIAGIIAVLRPGLAALALLFVIAAWSIVTGVLEIVAAIRLRKEIQGEWLLGLAGVISVIFGVVLFMNPAAGSLAVIWIIGAYLVLFGASLLGLAWRLRGQGATQPPMPA